MIGTVDELARLVDGIVVGNASLAISSARPLNLAGPTDISFVESEKHVAQLQNSRAGAVLAPRTMVDAGRPLIHVADPLAAFVTVFRHLQGLPEPEAAGIDPRAAIHPSAVIGEDAIIAPFAHVGEGATVGSRCRLGPNCSIGRYSRIGDDVTINANAVLYERTVVGHRVIIHAGACIGADGFGYRLRDGRHEKVPQLGYVEIGNDVEIGANAAIDCATFDVTRIGMGTKIDNLVQIGHNCQIGKHNILVGQCGVGGSSVTGDYVVIAGQAGLADHAEIGAQAIIGAQAGVSGHVPAKQRVLGTPAVAWRDFTHQVWAVGRLATWSKDLKLIKSKLGLGES